MMATTNAYTISVTMINRWLEVGDELDERGARELTDYIKTSVTDAFDLVIEVVVKRAWEHLGYSNFVQYWKAEFHEYTIGVPAAYREKTVANLTAAGMSTRAIEAVTGIAKSTVSRLQSGPVPNGTPGRRTPAADEQPAGRGGRHGGTATVIRLRDQAEAVRDAVTMTTTNIKFGDLETELIDSTIAACKAAASEYNRLARRLTVERDRRSTRFGTP